MLTDSCRYGETTRCRKLEKYLIFHTPSFHHMCRMCQMPHVWLNFYGGLNGPKFCFQQGIYLFRNVDNCSRQIFKCWQIFAPNFQMLTNFRAKFSNVDKFSCQIFRHFPNERGRRNRRTRLQFRFKVIYAFINWANPDSFSIFIISILQSQTQIQHKKRRWFAQDSNPGP